MHHSTAQGGGTIPCRGWGGGAGDDFTLPDATTFLIIVHLSNNMPINSEGQGACIRQVSMGFAYDSYAPSDSKCPFVKKLFQKYVWS